MSKKLFLVFALLAFVALPALAADGGSEGGAITPFAAWAIGLGIAAAGCGLGQGNAAAAAVSGIARNPGAAARVQTALLLSLAFMESLTIFALVGIFFFGLAGG
ncbi:MAG: hypothetical protein AAGA81_10170 [Acidobacteriota bacterium]